MDYLDFPEGNYGNMTCKILIKCLTFNCCKKGVEVAAI